MLTWSIHKALGEKFVLYVEGALYPSIFLLEIETDVMPIPQGWQGNYAYL